MSAQSLNRTLIVLVAIGAAGATTLATMAYLKRSGSLAPAGSAGGPAGSAGMAIAEGGSGGTPQVLFPVPDFQLVERSGKNISLADFRGKAWIASFVFTKCQGSCPAMMSRMYGLQEKLKTLPDGQWDEVRLVSVSVDPENDTPDVLKERARISRADDTHWLWLTGQKDAIWALTRDGFKLGLDPQPDNAQSPIAHSQKFVLVDRLGRIRGYYDGISSEYINADYEQNRLINDLKTVLKDPVGGQ